MPRKHFPRSSFIAVLLLLASVGQGFAQTSRFAFHATHYEVAATLRPSDQTLVAQAKVDFIADTASRALTVELHPDLKINSVKTANGQTVSYERDLNNGMLLHITLPDAIAVGRPVSLTFDYAGPITNDDDSPSRGIRLSWVDKTSAFLLLPSRWFPLTNYPSNRYTATFKIIVPESFAVAGTGRADSPTPMPGSEPGVGREMLYTFHCDQPAPVGTFVAGNLQLNPVQVEGMNISVYAPPAMAKTTTAWATEAAHALTFFSDQFGPLQSPSLTIAQMPEGSLQGFAAPGLLLVSARMWGAKPSVGLIGQLAANQWWGSSVLAASPADVWLTDGLARYSQALYQEQDEGNLGLHNALDQFAVGSLMYESQLPISQAQQLQPYSPTYESIVIDKGAMVFHMLRSEIGNDRFQALLHEFYSSYAGKTASLDQFEKLAESKAPPNDPTKPDVNLVAFFSQWLNSTGIPEFKLDYTVYRVQKGFRIVGKVTQDLETFQMPVQVRVDTEGNPESQTIDISGTSSPFTIETFGRPKANGVVLDPDNNILKSSPKLRVRATIALGEVYAAAGKYYEAVTEYQKALDIQPNDSLAHFRMGEAMFFQKNYQAGANSFRSALDGDLDPKWIEVWSHIYLGKIFDVTGQRDRALNEYQRAQQLKDNTAGAQAEASKYLQKPFSTEPAATADTKSSS